MTAVHEVLPYPHLRAREENTARLGMYVFLGSWAMLFGGLFFAYGSLRVAAAAWPPAGTPRLPIGLPLASTGLLALSSVALHLALGRIEEGAGGLRPILLSLSTGVAFLLVQSTLWVLVWQSGLVPSAGQYASVFWELTAFHGLHVLVGIFALAVLAVRAARGRYGPARHLAVRLWAMYWDFVGVVWLLIFLSVFAV